MLLNATGEGYYEDEDFEFTAQGTHLTLEYIGFRRKLRRWWIRYNSGNSLGGTAWGKIWTTSEEILSIELHAFRGNRGKQADLYRDIQKIPRGNRKLYHKCKVLA